MRILSVFFGAREDKEGVRKIQVLIICLFVNAFLIVGPILC